MAVIFVENSPEKCLILFPSGFCLNEFRVKFLSRGKRQIIELNGMFSFFTSMKPMFFLLDLISNFDGHLVLFVHKP